MTIHHLQNNYGKLRAALQLPPTEQKAMSRAQLPLILERVSVGVLNGLVLEQFGVELSAAAKGAVAIYRTGTVEKGDGRIETRNYQVFRVDAMVIARKAFARNLKCV